MSGSDMRKMNPYGDELKSVITGFGSDVSSQHSSVFEEAIIERAKVLQQSAQGSLVSLDLFSGYCATNARRLAELGFTAYASDLSPADATISEIIGRKLFSGGSLQYSQGDARDFDFAQLPGKLALVTGQRGLHFLHFAEAQALVVNLAEQMSSGASMFFSIGAVDCKVGGGYKHAALAVSERWHVLEPALGEPIHVTEPLCLYRRDDLDALFAAVKGSLVSVEVDDFGLFLVEFTT